MRNLRLVHSNPRPDRSSRAEHPTDRALTIAPLDPELRTLLEHVRIVAPLPRAVRARVLARARGAIAGCAAPATAKAPARRRSATIY